MIRRSSRRAHTASRGVLAEMPFLWALIERLSSETSLKSLRGWCRRTALLAALLTSAAEPVSGAQTLESAPEPLPSLCADGGTVTVSGVSSGGFLAHQFHVAHSATVSGAGIFAAGPYACAGTRYPATFLRALSVCSDIPDLFPFLGPPNVERSVQAAKTAAEAGSIDPLSGLAGDRVLLFSGQQDTLVPTSVVMVAGDFYRAYHAGAVDVVDDVEAAHAMVTRSFGNSCDTTKPPFINNCDFDLAGATLQKLLGPLAPPSEPQGRLIAFDQRSFADPERTSGLADTGYLYVPRDCEGSSGCRVHVALHGCQQTAAVIGDAFYRHAGYNRWADSNRIVVLYPQATAITRRFLGFQIPWPNPEGCWDWWGYTGDDYATKTAPQIAAIEKMIARLATSPVSDSSAPGSSCARAGGG